MKLNFFLLLILFTNISCEHGADDLNPNIISIIHDGKTLGFADIKIEGMDLDLNGGKGFTVYGIKKTEDTQKNNYYVFIDLQRDSLNNFVLHKIDFGVKKKIGTSGSYVIVYYANLTPGYNDTNFQYFVSTKGSVADGTFSGRLKSLHDGDIIITNGKFYLDFDTVRDY